MKMSRDFTRIKAAESSYLGWTHFLNDLNQFINQKVRHKDDGVHYVSLRGEPQRNRAILSVYTAPNQGHDPQKLLSATRYFLGENGIKIISEEEDDHPSLQGESVLLTVTGLNRYSLPDHFRNIKNTWMRNALSNGTAIDVREIGFEVEPGVFRLTEFIPGVEYVDSSEEAFIWSIGKDLESGEIYAATDTRFYQDDDYECLYLR
jgi:hypothetical protein